MNNQIKQSKTEPSHKYPKTKREIAMQFALQSCTSSIYLTLMPKVLNGFLNTLGSQHALPMYFIHTLISMTWAIWLPPFIGCVLLVSIDLYTNIKNYRRHHPKSIKTDGV